MVLVPPINRFPELAVDLTHSTNIAYIVKTVPKEITFTTVSCEIIIALILVGGAITILKNDGVRQWEGWHPIYEMEKKIMFQTTNQIYLVLIFHVAIEKTIF